MSTDTPSVELNDEEADNLLDRLVARAEERDDINLGRRENGGISRRTLLAGMAGGAGIAALTGNASAAPSWGSATGKAGTQAKPLSAGYIQNLTSQTVDTDEVNNTTYIDTADDPISTINSGGANSHFVFRPGTHTISLDANDNGIIVDNSNVTIIIPESAALKLANSEYGGGTDCGLISIAGGASAVTVAGAGTIDGNEANQANNTEGWGLVHIDDNCSDIKVQDLTLTETPGCAVRPFGSSTNRVEKVWMTDLNVVSGWSGIVGEYTDHVHIRDCEIRNTTNQDGIEPAAECDDWTIRGCTISDTQQAGIDVYRSSKNIHITDNTFINCAVADEDIMIYEDTGTIEDVRITDNKFVNGNNKAIQATQATELIISDNLIINPAGRGIDLGSVAKGELANNIVQGAGSHGLYLSSGANRIVCTANNVNGCGGDGINLQSCTNSFVTSNMSWGNTGANLNDSSAVSTDVTNNKTT